MLASSYYLPTFSPNSQQNMTANDQQNIERKLNHVLDMGQRIIDLYPHITCTERTALLLAMTAAIRQVRANMQTVAALLRKNLLDPFRINYTDYARSIENLLKIWQEELVGAPIFHNLDNQSLPITNPEEIAFKEDTDYDLTLKTDDVDMYELRVNLMNSASVMCEAIEDGLEKISRELRTIVNDYSELKSNPERQDKRLRELEDFYAQECWEEDRERFVKDVEEYTNLSGDKEKTTYKRYLDHIEREATDRHYIKVLAELNEWYLEGERPASFIVANRDKLTIDDMARHFCFVRCHRLLKKHIESFDLMLPPDEEYNELFVNKAAQELGFILAPTIGTYVDFRHNYQYAALQMAMMDLGLVYSDRRNGPQMMKYINQAYLTEDEYIQDQTTLTQWTRKLLSQMFGTMDESHLIGNYSKVDFEKMKDYYWLCLSIINKVLQLNLEELHFASYLYIEHEKTPSINDYRDKEGQSIMERLSILNSAMRGEKVFT